jgi:hypothetical protein
MGEGTVRITNAKRWRQPVLLTGEMKESRWRQFESVRPEVAHDRFTLIISALRNLRMMIMCESDEQPAAIRQVEGWVNSPCSSTD